ncbi:MAG TPA: hypothetical protein VEB64_01895 [Azospirillaceae bacterium]|nr:hypothetical protein [Azospirillaceae bacterium]
MAKDLVGWCRRVAAALAGTGFMLSMTPVLAQSDPELARRLERMEAELHALRAEVGQSRSAVWRLQQLEGDLRQALNRNAGAVGRLSSPVAPPAPASTPAKNTPPANGPVSITAPQTIPATVPLVASPAHLAPQVPPEELLRALGTDQFAVLLGVYRTPREALRGWVDLLRSHGGVLGPLQPRVIGVDYGNGQGTVYSLKAGPIVSKELATAACDALKGRRIPACDVGDFTGTPGAEFWQGV